MQPLSFMGYVITDGESFVIDGNGKSISKDQKATYVWRSEEAALNVLRDCENRKVMPLVGFHTKALKVYQTPIDDETEQAINNIHDFFKLYNQIKDNMIDLKDRLSIVDRKISDVEHYAEITNQNAVNGFKLYKKLKELRIERRNIKRLIELKKVFDNIQIDSKVQTDMNDVITRFNTRMFSPREIDIDDILN